MSDVTLFATACHNLRCLLDKKSQLAATVFSSDWDENRWANSQARIRAKSTLKQFLERYKRASEEMHTFVQIAENC